MRLTVLHAASLIVAFAVQGAADEPEKPWGYQGEFHKTIAGSDRIAIRCGGFNCCQPVDGHKLLFEVKNSQEIKEVYDHIQFKALTDRCFCCGYPGIDWYRGGKRVALTSLQHGRALRWNGFPKLSDGELTEESARWLVVWFAKHGVPQPKREVDAPETGRAARAVLRQFMPHGYLEAVTAAEKEIESCLDNEKADALLDRRIRAVFTDKKSMYTALFRIMGCLPMHWNARYSPEQLQADRFLDLAPRAELDEALRTALRSNDPTEKHGAARVVYSQSDMLRHGKTCDDLTRWAAMFADEAYSDPFPENRRRVLSYFWVDPEVAAWGVLKQAVADPDATVRREAVRALAVRKGPLALAILRDVESGRTVPRQAKASPVDYTYGDRVDGWGLEWGEDDDLSGSDRDAARNAIEQLK